MYYGSIIYAKRYILAAPGVVAVVGRTYSKDQMRCSLTGLRMASPSKARWW